MGAIAVDERLDAEEQFVGAERFAEVIITASLTPPDPVRNVTSRRDEEDGRGGRPADIVSNSAMKISGKGLPLA